MNIRGSTLCARWWILLAVVLPLTLSGRAEGGITWNVTFGDTLGAGTGVGFDHPMFGQTRRDTALAVFDYLNTVLDANGTVDFVFQASLNTGTSTFFAFGATSYSDTTSGFHNGDVFQHATTGVDPNPTPSGQYDGRVRFDFGYTDLPTPAFQLNNGLGAPAANQVDLFSVILHEVTHALGFTSLLNGSLVSDLTGTSPGVFTRFDELLQRADGTQLFGPGGEFLGNAADLTGDIRFGGAAASAVNGGAVPLYMPATFQYGSSIQHLPSQEFGGVRNVMYWAPRLGGNREYTELELAMLQDLGWTLKSASAVPAPAGVLLGLAGAASLGGYAGLGWLRRPIPA